VGATIVRSKTSCQLIFVWNATLAVICITTAILDGAPRAGSLYQPGGSAGLCLGHRQKLLFRLFRYAELYHPLMVSTSGRKHCHSVFSAAYFDHNYVNVPQCIRSLRSDLSNLAMVQRKVKTERGVCPLFLSAMNFLYLSCGAFFAGLGLGYIKFFLLGLLCNELYTLADKKWVIQAVGAIITVGPCVVYVAAGPLASAYKKQWIMFWSGALTALGMLAGFASNWAPNPWFYIFWAGLLMGVFNPAKNAVVPLEAAYGGCSTELINAVLNIAYLAGILGGIPAGAWFYDYHPALGALLVALVFAVAAVWGGLCSYPEETRHLRPFRQSSMQLLKESLCLLRKYALYLLAGPLIWGIASAVSLAITAYAQEEGLGGDVACSMLSVCAIGGVAIGALISPQFVRWRYQSAALAVVLMACVMLVLPSAVEMLKTTLQLRPTTVYWYVATTTGMLGIMFGIATNLIEAEFFRLIYEEGKEGTGAALLSAGTAFFPFCIGGTIGWLLSRGWMSATSQFYLMAALTLAATAAIYVQVQRKRRCTGL